MRLTGAQQAAITTFGRPVMVEAGAGAGKTWVLVQRFLHLLEQNPDWPVESIVAVTFTEKAAREMRTRIRQQVEEKAQLAPHDTNWQMRRRDLDLLQVGTVHGLCARILRENAVAAQIDPHFQVLDEQETEVLREQAVRRMLGELAASNGILGAGELELLESYHVRDLHEQLARLLEKRGEASRLFKDLPDPPDLIKSWEKFLEHGREEIWQRQVETTPDLRTALEALPLIEILDMQDKLAPSVERAQQGCRALQDNDLAGALLDWLQIGLKGGTASSWGGKEQKDNLKAWLKLLRDAAQEIQKAGCAGPPGPEDEKAAWALACWRDLWAKLELVYRQTKDERRALDFDDLEILTEALLQEQPRTPRLQGFLEGIRQVMVDEFQDTNARQQNIVYALADPRRGSELFVVGDAKQSIYRFRQAQVAVFNRTGSDIAAATGEPAINLDRSFRTHCALVAGLNELFDRILIPQGARHAVYEARPGALEAERSGWPVQPVCPAPIELHLLPDKDEQAHSVGTDEARLFEARQLAERLLELAGQNFQVWDKDRQIYRGFRFDDAAVLFRATTSLPLYEEQFKAAGLPYLTVSGRGYYNQPEVRDLVALLKALYNQADDLSLASALRSPLFSLSDETLYCLRWHSSSDGRRELQPYNRAILEPAASPQPAQVSFAAQTLQELWKLVGRVEVWQLLRTALDLTGYDVLLALADRALPGGGRQYSNLQKLLELARQRGGAGLSEFLSGLEDLRAREAREGEALGSTLESGRVQLMSIHASKGLEFPVVAVADLGRRKRHTSGQQRLSFDPAYGLVCMVRDADGEWLKPASYAWAQKQDEWMEAAELKRLLYVACTRAADLLILSGRTGEHGSWLEDILSAWNLEEYGPEEEILNRGEYTLRVVRPVYQRMGAITEEAVTVALPSAFPFSEIPALALPLPPRPRVLSQAVTHFSPRPDPDPLAGAGRIVPAVRPLAPEQKSPRAPAFRVGRLVHRALANWNCLSLPFPQLLERLRVYARREGIYHPAAIEQAAGRAQWLLDSLRASPLYQELNSAPVCRREIPFTLGTPAGVLHGMIDLLYQDPGGGWRLLDWKTEWVPAGELEDQAKQHCFQMSVYSEAARQVLGVFPHVSVCFLSHNAYCRSFSREELEEAYRNLETIQPYRANS